MAGLGPRSKYNVRQDRIGKAARTVDGQLFHSAGEAGRFVELQRLQHAWKIHDLRTQVEFPLVVNEILISHYRADFVYRIAKTATRVVEDFKGVETELYRIKKKLMYALYGIEIKEVRA